MSRLSLGLVLVLVACGPGPGPGPSGTGGGLAAGGGLSGTGGGFSSTGGGSSSTGGGAAGGGAPGGGAATGWTAASCDAAMEKFASASCADRQSWLDLKVSACAKLGNTNSTALCGAAMSKANACQAQFVSQGMVACTAFGTDTNDTCGVDVVLGALCAATVNNVACAGVTCQYNSDCPTGWTCNDQTDRCVQTSARCPGLPCRYNADCPTGFTCNNGTGQCNAN